MAFKAMGGQQKMIIQHYYLTNRGRTSFVENSDQVKVDNWKNFPALDIVHCRAA